MIIDLSTELDLNCEGHLAVCLGIQISQSPINGSLTLNCNGLVHIHTDTTSDFSS
jgi:hypothetical protein